VNFTRRYAARLSMPFVVGLLLILAIISGVNLPSVNGTASYVQVSSTSPASANSCTVALKSYVTTASPDVSNIAVIVPVQAQCSIVNGELYAAGYAYDGMTNAHLSAADTILLPNIAGTTYVGELVFNFPTTQPQAYVQDHATVVSVSIFSGSLSSNASALATTSEIVALDAYTLHLTPPYINYGNCPYGQAEICNTMYNPCQSPSNNSTTQCVGHLYQDSNGCVELAFSVFSPYGLVSSQYYTLVDLPSSYPPIGTWVTVTGILNQGYNSASNGSACPGNYIIVTSISQ